MVPFYNSFRIMVKHYVPKLSSTNIDEYDHLITLPHHLREQIFMLTGENLRSLEDADLKTFIKDEALRRKLKEIRQESENLQKKELSPFKTELDLIQQLWAARRKLTLHQDVLFQLPFTWTRILRYRKLAGQYFTLRAKIFSKLQLSRFKNQSLLYIVTRCTFATIYFGLMIYYLLGFGDHAL